MTVVKIKIKDNKKLREEIDTLYQRSTKEILAKWAIDIAKRIMQKLAIDYTTIPEIQEGFNVNELWQKGEARMYDVRQTGFRVNRLCKEATNEIEKMALRMTTQAVASGHMAEHALVASDYAIKVINLVDSDDSDWVTRERETQLALLKKLNCE